MHMVQDFIWGTKSCIYKCHWIIHCIWNVIKKRLYIISYKWCVLYTCISVGVVSYYIILQKQHMYLFQLSCALGEISGEVFKIRIKNMSTWLGGIGVLSKTVSELHITLRLGQNDYFVNQKLLYFDYNFTKFHLFLRFQLPISQYWLR